jgi:nucleoside-diphosphate-sugar epimerase
VALLEELLDRPLRIEHLDLGPGDPRRTDADITRAMRDLGYEPATALTEGLTAHLEALQVGPRVEVVA